MNAEDRLEILDLISRYSYAWDAKDAEGWAALFLDDAVVSTYAAGRLTAETRSHQERLTGAYARFYQFTQQGIQTRHYQTNTVLEELADGAVQGRTLLAVIWQYSDRPEPKLMRSGMYLDRFVRTPSGWKFANREIRIDHS